MSTRLHPDRTASVPDTLTGASAASGPRTPSVPAFRNVGVILPYAVSIRDFVHSGVMGRLLAMPDVLLTIYTLNPGLPELADARAAGVAIRPFSPYRDNRIERFLKRFYLYFFADQFVHVELALAAKPGRRLVARATCALRRMLGTKRLLGIFERVMLAIYRRRAIPPMLEEAPDLVIATRSLMNSLDYGLIAEARERGFPILTIANSWDNFTTKGFFPFRAKQILVWNRKMLTELEEIYEVPAADVSIVGYPRQQTLITLADGCDAEAYLKSLGYADYQRFILYSASYSELSRVKGEAQPLEYQVMALVAARLEEMLPDDVCILLRMHPFSDAGDTAFAGLKRSFVYVPGRKDKYVERVMGPEDEAHLARQIALSECVLSMASTMTIDALSLGKAVLNIRFDPRQGIPFIQSNARFYSFNHFRDLVSLVKLPIADTPEQVVDFVEEVLEGDTKPRADMAAFRTHYVPDSSADYAKAVSDLIRQALGLPDAHR